MFRQLASEDYQDCCESKENESKLDELSKLEVNQNNATMTSKERQPQDQPAAQPAVRMSSEKSLNRNRPDNLKITQCQVEVHHTIQQPLSPVDNSSDSSVSIVPPLETIPPQQWTPLTPTYVTPSLLVSKLICSNNNHDIFDFCR